VSEATIVARSRDELVAATERFPRYFARAAYSRGGVELLTNTGPLAGHVSIDEVTPTNESPWLVQEFVDGPMLCTYSTLHEGNATAHCAYRAPRQWEHSTGIQFESVDGRESLAVVETIGRALGYTGQISFDFVVATDGIVIIECNPRTTDGVLLMDPARSVGASRSRGDSCRWWSRGAWWSSTSPSSRSSSGNPSGTPRGRFTTSFTCATPTPAGTTACRSSIRSSPSPTTSA
jgi:hypothetical protein